MDPKQPAVSERLSLDVYSPFNCQPEPESALARHPRDRERDLLPVRRHPPRRRCRSFEVALGPAPVPAKNIRRDTALLLLRPEGLARSLNEATSQRK